MFSSSGILKYSDDPYKCIVEIDTEIVEYYASWLKKQNIKFQRQLYSPHISVVRKEIPRNLHEWRKFNDKLINFVYDNRIYSDKRYIWLKCYSIELENIRDELGLFVGDLYGEIPKPYRHTFHITLANTKFEIIMNELVKQAQELDMGY